DWRERSDPEDAKKADNRKTSFRRGNFQKGILPCSSPACREGGYQVDRLIAEMLSRDELEYEGIMLCAGREVAEDGRRGPLRCPHRIELRVRLERKPAEEQEAKPKRRPHRRRRSHAA
ncbi:MAG: hypothetical protein ACRDFS_01655, partial [Chloroflexota bacterium]